MRQQTSASLRRIQVKAYQLAQLYAKTIYPFYYSDRFFDWSTGNKVTDY